MPFLFSPNPTSSLFRISLLIGIFLVSNIGLSKSNNQFTFLQPPDSLIYTASSTQKHYRLSHLTKDQTWLVWGSKKGDVNGAWLKVKFPAFRTLHSFEFTPGDETRAGSYAFCGRPRKLKIKTSSNLSYSFTLKDRRYRQKITFNPPLHTSSLTFEFVDIYGKSLKAGVCLSKPHFWVSKDAFKSLPNLREQIISRFTSFRSTDFTLKSLSDQDLKELKNWGTLTHPFWKQAFEESIKQKKISYQARLLLILKKLHLSSFLIHLQKYENSIFPQNRSLYTTLLVVLGDQEQTQRLLSSMQDLPLDQQTNQLQILAQTHSSIYLPTLFNALGRFEEIDQKIYPHLVHFPQILKFIRTQEKTTDMRKKGVLLRIETLIQPQRVRQKLLQALEVQDNPIYRSNAIRAAAAYQDSRIRNVIHRLQESAYLIERKSVAMTLSKWGQPQDLQALMNLARDKSVRVRIYAFKGLAHLKETPHSFLKLYALSGSDAQTALQAAHTWMTLSSNALDTALELLGSQFKEVRLKAKKDLIDVPQKICISLMQFLVHHKTNLTEAQDTLKVVWSTCASESLQWLLDHPPRSAVQIRFLELFKKWKVSQGYSYALSFVQNPSIVDVPLKKEALITLQSLSAFETRKPIIEPYLKSTSDELYCLVIQDFAHNQHSQSLPLLKKALTSLIEKIPQSLSIKDQCHLKAIASSGSVDFAPLLIDFYTQIENQWSYAQTRLLVLKSLSKLPTPKKLEILMRAMSDPYKPIKKFAETALTLSP